MSDFQQISNEARERLAAELQTTVATFGAAVDEAANTMLAAAEVEARRAEQLAGPGLEPLRKLSAELLETATELDRNVRRLSELAAEAAAKLRWSLAAEPPATEPAGEASTPRFEGQSPLDEIDEVRNSIAETPIDPTPGSGRFRPSDGPAEQESEAESPPVPDGVRLVIEQMRIAGEPDSAIVEHLESAGVDDPAGVLDRVSTSS